MQHPFAGSIDLETETTLEKYLYPELSWQTHIPIDLKLSRNENNFYSFEISREGDFVEAMWFQISFEIIDKNKVFPKNFLHNLFESIEICKNSRDPDKTVLWHVDSVTLDLLSNFNKMGKGYKKMINIRNNREKIQKDLDYHLIPDLQELVLDNFECKKTNLMFPIPFKIPFCIAATPFCTVSLECTLNSSLISGLKILNFRAGLNYKIIPNSERIKLATKPSRIVIDTYQTHKYELFKDKPTPSLDFIQNGAIRALLFCVREKNKFSKYRGNILQKFSMAYEATLRLNNPASFFSKIQPYFHADKLPQNGMYMYSFSNGKLSDSKVNASTNFGRLTNVSFMPEFKEGVCLDDLELVVVAVRRVIWEISEGFIKLID